MLSNGIIFSTEYVCNDIVCWFLIFVSDDIVYYTITTLSNLHQKNATLAVVRKALHQARSLGFDKIVILSDKKLVKAITFELQCTSKDGCAL